LTLHNFKLPAGVGRALLSGSAARAMREEKALAWKRDRVVLGKGEDKILLTGRRGDPIHVDASDRLGLTGHSPEGERVPQAETPRPRAAVDIAFYCVRAVSRIALDVRIEA